MTIWSKFTWFSESVPAISATSDGQIEQADKFCKSTFQTVDDLLNYLLDIKSVPDVCTYEKPSLCK